jgi:hypothetical protein
MTNIVARPTRTRRQGLPHDVTVPSSPSLLLPANLLIFTANLPKAVKLAQV